MPFDALLSPARPRLLSDILDELGAAPVPPQVLAQHKQAQLERFAPSFWHRNNAWLPVGLMGSVACLATSGGVTNSLAPGSALPSWLSLFWLGVMTLLIVFGVFRVSAGAHWEERQVDAAALRLLAVPSAIARLAREMHYALPGSRLILGELVQEQVVLDPYLLFAYDGEQVCLGIWDGGRIIATAS